VVGNDAGSNKGHKRPLKRWSEAIRLSTVGLTLAFSVIIGALAGHWLDGLLGTEPWLTVVGLCLGSAAGFVHLAQELQRMDGSDD